jgi:hypothetical protein
VDKPIDHSRGGHMMGAAGGESTGAHMMALMTASAEKAQKFEADIKRRDKLSAWCYVGAGIIALALVYAGVRL